MFYPHTYTVHSDDNDTASTAHASHQISGKACEAGIVHTCQYTGGSSDTTVVAYVEVSATGAADTWIPISEISLDNDPKAGHVAVENEPILPYMRSRIVVGGTAPSAVYTRIYLGSAEPLTVT